MDCVQTIYNYLYTNLEEEIFLRNKESTCPENLNFIAHYQTYFNRTCWFFSWACGLIFGQILRLHPYFSDFNHFLLNKL